MPQLESKPSKGLYNKYNVTKANGEPVDPNAQYLVLRLDTDMAAREAAVCYATAIAVTNPQLAVGIFAWVDELTPRENIKNKLP